MVLVSCHNSPHTTDAPVAASAASSSVLEPETECERIRTCLATLPHEYGPATPDLSEKVGACLGRTPLEKWNARRCVPFEVATDATTGKKIEAYVACSDVCPDYVRTGIRYVDVRQPECECVGGEPIGLGGVGCAPRGTVRAEGPDSVEVVGSGQFEIKPRGAFPHVRLGYLGLARPVDSINGERVRDAGGLRNVARQLLAAPPASVRFLQSGHTRVAYPERAAFEAVARRMSDLPFTARRALDCPAPDGSRVTLCVDDRTLGCDPAHDRACASFVAEVERAAGAVSAARPRARSTARTCAAFRRLRRRSLPRSRRRIALRRLDAATAHRRRVSEMSQFGHERRKFHSVVSEARSTKRGASRGRKRGQRPNHGSRISRK